MAARADQIVLVGLPGAGKSTVGPLLAQRLDWQFVDLDARIEADQLISIRQFITDHGEQEFRRVERELTERLACEPRVVLAPGGGWILHNRLPAATLVWLKVTPAEALRRLHQQIGTRPLLQPDPRQRMHVLLAEREHLYAKANIHIDTDGLTADQVVDAVLVAVKRENGN